MNYSLFKIELDSIPLFTGANHEINLFVNTCDRICTKYTANVEVRDLIFQTIQTKLRDRAKTLICSRAELNSWALVKNAIYSYFGDKRDFSQLVHEFNNTRMFPKEDTINFGHRVQDLLSQLMTKLAQTNNIEHKAERADIYAQTALEVYLLNLPEDIQIHVRPLNPESLEVAIGQVQDAVNFKMRSNAIRSSKPPQQQQQQNQPQMRKHTFNQPSRNYQPPFQNTSFPTNVNYNTSPNSSFPRAPIFIKQNPNQTRQNFPTNRQVFGPPKNVFAPGKQTTSYPQPKPTPMSGVSTIPPTGQQKTYRNRPFDVNNTEIQEEEIQVTPIYNENDGLWYTPVEPPQEMTYDDELLQHQYDDEETANFTTHASQDNSIS